MEVEKHLWKYNYGVQNMIKVSCNAISENYINIKVRIIHSFYYTCGNISLELLNRCG